MPRQGQLFFVSLLGLCSVASVAEVACSQPGECSEEAAGRSLLQRTSSEEMQVPSGNGAVVASIASGTTTCKHPTSCDGACGALLKLIRQKRDSSTWTVYYDEVADFLLERKATRVVEIGTAWGGLAKRLLERMPSLELHSIDPFMAGYDKADLLSKTYDKIMQQFKLGLDEFSTTLAQAMSYEQGTHNGFGCRYVLHHKKSTEAAPEFAPASVDGIFIDGLHTYEGVVEDIAAWKGIAKPQGVLMFNDYGVGPFPGVKKAAQEYASSAVGLDAIKHIGEKKHGNVYIEVSGPATGPSSN